MVALWVIIGGAVTVAVICCAEPGVAKPAGVETLMLVVPEVRGWKLTDFWKSLAPKTSGVPRMVPTAVFELLTATLMGEAGVTLA